MSLADDVKNELKKAERQGGPFREQLLRYRRFKAELARAGVVPRRDTYDIPLMSRLRRSRSAAKAGNQR
ncbi:MAG: hypothetical protein ACLFV8_11900 [Alphaproteobacteria bacterium]